MANIKQIDGSVNIKDNYQNIYYNDNVLNLELMSLQNNVSALNTSDITNTSNVSGNKSTDALNTLKTIIELLENSDITNVSSVSGSKSSDALNTLDARIDNIIAQSGTSDTEVVDARESTLLGIIFTLLGDRLDWLETQSVALNDGGLDYKYSLKLVAGKPVIEYEEV